MRVLQSGLKNASKIVGVKQLRKALTKGTVLQVYLALDADPALTEPVAAQCAAQDVPVDWVPGGYYNRRPCSSSCRRRKRKDQSNYTQNCISYRGKRGGTL